MSKTFDTLDVVTVSTGVLVSTRGIGAVYEVLNYLLDDDLMTHQLPAASRAVEPSLRQQHAWIGDLNPPRDDKDALWEWCLTVVADHGHTLDLEPATDVQWKTYNALQDLTDLAGKRRVIAVQIGDTSSSETT